MNLAVFDIDGTLTDTMKVDRCFIKAMDLEFAIRNVDENWARYTNATDSSIIVEIFKEKLNRPPSRAETKAMQERFLALLKEAKLEDPGQFLEIKGASMMLRNLQARPGWTAALATGGWGIIARYKLASAEIPFNGLPFASADDGLSREEIVRSAIERAKQAAGVKRFKRIVSFGDGVWDLKTARNLGLEFCGVGQGDALLKAGADTVLPDFSDSARISGLFSG